jgi:hypothetical protein
MRASIGLPMLLAIFAFSPSANALEYMTNRPHSAAKHGSEHHRAAVRQRPSMAEGFWSNPSPRHDDCPNGDCRGLNSPGFMGGGPGNF